MIFFVLNLNYELQSLLIPLNLPKTTDFRICTTIPLRIFMVEQIWSPYLPIMTFSLCAVSWNSWIPKMTLFDFNVKKEFWSFLIPENLSKMTLFWIELWKSTQNNIFSDQVKISPKRQLFFWSIFSKKKTNNSVKTCKNDRCQHKKIHKNSKF